MSKVEPLLSEDQIVKAQEDFVSFLKDHNITSVNNVGIFFGLILARFTFGLSQNESTEVANKFCEIVSEFADKALEVLVRDASKPFKFLN